MRIGSGIWLLIAFITLRCCAAPVEDTDVDAVVDALINDSEWARTGHESEKFERFVKKYAIPTELQNADWRSFQGERAKGTCTVCKAFVRTIMTMQHDGFPMERIKATIIKLCTTLNLFSPAVCSGIIELQTPAVFYIINGTPKLEASDACGVILQTEHCSTISEQHNWTIAVDENEKRQISPFITEETYKVVQLTDIHYDPLYEPNGNSHCGEPICCRKGQNATNISGKVAGYWGDYNDCDVPWHSVEDTLDHVKNTHKDATEVYFTGDLIDHGVWATTQEGNVESIKKSYAKIKETFPDIPVYPIIGNHEPQPVNLFAPNYVKEQHLSTEWLYKLSAEIWINYGWLPETTRETILRGGFYSVSPRKGLRIIAINNNVCYTFNWWLLHDPRDPGGQLEWLAETLLEAERNSEFVHILAHIPTGDKSCYKAWSLAYRKIVNRFAHIISAQFNGHTHFDEFNVYYDLRDRQTAINVAWNGGSVTPFSNVNPNYKVYIIDAKNFAVADIDNWMFNLALANETPEKRPKWYKSYSFKEEYNLSDLSMSSIHSWILGVAKNYTMLEQYRKNFYKRADPSISQNCDDDCLRNHLCVIVTTSANDETECNSLLGTSDLT